MRWNRTAEELANQRHLLPGCKQRNRKEWVVQNIPNGHRITCKSPRTARRRTAHPQYVALASSLETNWNTVLLYRRAAGATSAFSMQISSVGADAMHVTHQPIPIKEKSHFLAKRTCKRDHRYYRIHCEGRYSFGIGSCGTYNSGMEFIISILHQGRQRFGGGCAPAFGQHGSTARSSLSPTWVLEAASVTGLVHAV